MTAEDSGGGAAKGRAQPIGAPGSLARVLDRWRGRRITYGLDAFRRELREVEERGARLVGLSDAELRERADGLRREPGSVAEAVKLRAECYALVREAAARTVGLRPYDEQVAGAIALHQGKLLEMATGEGKTLAAVLPAVLEALGGGHVHVLTFNDYLAGRDAAWMGPIYGLLGVSVAHVDAGMNAAERRRAYGAEVTYVTAKEAGFDHLRDGLCLHAGDRVHRDLDYAIVDEADSILIDQARIPLVLAGSRDPAPRSLGRMAAVARALRPGADYEVLPREEVVFLTEQGQRRAELLLECGALHEAANTSLLAELNLALHAKELLRRDVDYIVRDGALQMVDALTGRVASDRRWPDGLHEALEAKEGLRSADEGEILDTITLQDFFRLYRKLSGMTGTVRPDDEELAETYGLATVVLPMHHACVREDRPDRVFTHREARDDAVVAEIERSRRRGRPVLVGTSSVRASEELAARLEALGIPASVLNARTDDVEARIIAEAGAPGAVTISTNMAGRGTDIRLGGADERERERVVAAGGLLVIGTGRHESRRIDRQLRGRAGRQGDPGASCIYVSLDDEIVRRYGVDALIPARFRRRRPDAIGHPLVRDRIRRAQRAIEGRNYDIRRQLLTFSRFITAQRADVRAMRDELLESAVPPSRWLAARPERHARLVELVGSEGAAELERLASLHCIDRLWVEHLAAVEQLREGIHIRRVAQLDTYHEFVKDSAALYRALIDRIEAEIVAPFDRLELTSEGATPEGLGLRPPTVTWTYLVEDDPFRDVLGLHIAGSIGLSLGAFLVAPLYLAAGLFRMRRRRREERADPHPPSEE